MTGTDAFGFIALTLAVSLLSGAFWWWVFWRIAAVQGIAESNAVRRTLKGLGLFFGLATPVLALIALALFFYF